MVAYDLDGTLCSETPLSWWEKPLFLLFGDAYGRFRKAWERPILNPDGEYIIITSRTGTKRHATRTCRWLNKYGYKGKFTHMKSVVDHDYNAVYKARICRLYNINRYYENEPAVAQYLRETVPGMEVVEV